MECNMLYCATVVASAAGITHNLHHCQLSVIYLVINKRPRMRERKRERENERHRERERERD